MKKRSATIVLALVLVFTIMAGTLSVKAADSVNQTIFTVKSSAKKVCSGDTVKYTVTLGEVRNLGSIRFRVTLPKGMELIENSSKVEDVLGNESTSFNEKSFIYMAGGFSEGYSSDKDTLLLSFKCKVNEQMKKGSKVGLEIDPEEIFEFSADGDAPLALIPFEVVSTSMDVKGSCDENPKTGDANNMGMWILVMAVSMAGITSVIYKKNKEKSW